MQLNFKGCLILKNRQIHFPKNAEIGDAYEIYVVTEEIGRNGIVLARDTVNYGIRIFDGKYWQTLENTESTLEDVYVKDGDSVRIEKRECKKITINAEDYEGSIKQEEKPQETDWRQDYANWKSKQD